MLEGVWGLVALLLLPVVYVFQVLWLLLAVLGAT